MNSLYNKWNAILWGLAFTIITSAVSCNKLVEIDAPVSTVNQANVYANDATATAALTGIYISMGDVFSVFTGKESISLRSGLSADEFTLSNEVTDTKLIAYYQNSLSDDLSLGAEMWEPLYKNIFFCNSAIEGLSSSTALTTQVKQQLTGEAKFIRAFCYFYLVNLFGDVPLAVTSDYKVNASMGRASKKMVYQQVLNDLLDARAKLDDNYLDGKLQPYKGAIERVRPNKAAATALLARVYLYTNDYANAETYATQVINNSTLFSLPTLDNTFLKNSIEAIWQLQPSVSGWNTGDAQVFVINNNQGNDKPVYLNQGLLDAFENGDARKNEWIHDTIINNVNYYYPYKYRNATFNEPVTEYLMVLRLAEQYLIRAEARAQENNFSGALEDLNIIRARAGLISTTAGDKNSLLAAILQERRIEFFSEWGHRWLDIKRTNEVDKVMTIITSQKGGTWKEFQELYPLPLTDIQKNKNLIQNYGY
ncbi:MULTISPECIES: RagB/SusD family nutrient uptake outer membrane protein [Niastella]|uniref:RagB/SusD family nutrient uptake outer membrane protein n=1 Tax=Niastella soli TaxID=2821487 RepID=A0ABS3YZC6_9BACT|nr:RagB/SusD family nutrient uptake outer membrane protein [Niastella soli]MBO9203273.1 RagB/SusD family nutrient uptake outer membrane protein [Niastella soli]